MNGMEQGRALFDKCKEVGKKLLLEKRSSVLLCVGIVGMALILLSTVIKPGGKEERAAAGSGSGGREYAAQMESRLAGIIGSIDGVGRCEVMVTTESGVEHVYAMEETRNVNESSSFDGEGLQRRTQQENSAQKMIVVDTGGGKKEALLKTERPPQIQGVVVVCEGAGSAIVQQRVTEVVATALNIPYTKVCVTKIGK